MYLSLVIGMTPPSRSIAIFHTAEVTIQVELEQQVFSATPRRRTSPKAKYCIAAFLTATQARSVVTIPHTAKWIFMVSASARDVSPIPFRQINTTRIEV